MILKHVLNLAVEWEIIPTSPAARIKAIKTPPGRLRYLYPEELRTLIDACPAWLKPIVQFAVSTGARRGSICDLRWRDISPDGQRATFQKTKSGRRHTIKLNDLARFALTTAWNEGCRPDDRIFGVQHGAIDSVSIAFHRAALKAKIDDFRFHDLRHTAASWLAMKGRSIREIAELLDHSTIQMTMRYSHLAPDFMEQTVKALDEVFHKTLTALPAAAAEEESRICPHNRPGDECDACLRDGDFAFDAAREARYK
jgi:integrase